MLPVCEQSTSSCEIKLRELEIDSYSKIISVFRARGNLTNERRKLLKQIESFLNISRERHRAEIRRVTNDELLSTIATRLTGQDWTVDWNEEGKRLVPTPTPFSHYTVNSPLADYIASVASLGKKYVELYNQRVCDSVPNSCKNNENVESSNKLSTEKWSDEITKLFSSVQNEKFKDVSIQTAKVKVIPKKCTFCERRRKRRLESKESAMKLLDLKESPENKQLVINKEEKSEVNDDSIILPSGKRIVVENALDNMEDLSVSVIAQEIVVETEPLAGPSRSQDSGWEDLSHSALPPPVVLTTPDFSGLNVDSSNLMAKDNMDPSSFQQLFSSVWENSETPLQPRIPRILNSGTRKKGRKQSLPSVKSSSPVERGVKKRGGTEYYKEPYTSRENISLSVGQQGPSFRYTKPAQVPPVSARYRQDTSKNHGSVASKQCDNILKHQEYHLKYPPTRSNEAPLKRQVDVLRQHDPSRQYEPLKKRREVPKQREVISKQHEVLLKHHEGVSKYPEVVPRHIDSSSKPSGGIYKHYVRVRHTPKPSKPLVGITQSQTEYLPLSQQVSETVEIPIEYLQNEQVDKYNPPMEVVEINDFRVATAGLSSSLLDNQQNYPETMDHSQDHPSDQRVTSVNIVSTNSPETFMEEILISASQSSNNNNEEGKTSLQRKENSIRKLINIYNGEKKVHGSIHFQTDHVKEVISTIPNAHNSQGGVNNGCQPDESTAVIQGHAVWDGTSLSGGEFIMEDVSIVEGSSYPMVNGHEEIILEEEVLSGNEIMEGFVNKSGVCVVPQSDVKFSVMDLTDFTGSIENIHSAPSQSKDDSRDSDIMINRP